MKVGIKFCGNCNPTMDTAQVAKRLAGLAEIDFVHWESGEYDVLLILSGCRVDCASRPDFPGPRVIVAGSSVNRIPVPEENLIDEILTAVNNAVSDPI